MHLWPEICMPWTPLGVLTTLPTAPKSAGEESGHSVPILHPFVAIAGASTHCCHVMPRCYKSSPMSMQSLFLYSMFDNIILFIVISGMRSRLVYFVGLQA